jgi:hypothetical protein
LATSVKYSSLDVQTQIDRASNWLVLTHTKTPFGDGSCGPRRCSACFLGQQIVLRSIVDSVRFPYVFSACSCCDKPKAIYRDCLRSDCIKASTTPSWPFRGIGDTRRAGSGFSKKKARKADIWWRIGDAQPDTLGHRGEPVVSSH